MTEYKLVVVGGESNCPARSCMISIYMYLSCTCEGADDRGMHACGVKVVVSTCK